MGLGSSHVADVKEEKGGGDWGGQILFLLDETWMHRFEGMKNGGM